MPLVQGKSNEARSENIKRELEEHPEMNPKQAAAIAYSVQRKHAKDKKAKDSKMAKDSTGSDPGAPHQHFQQALDALHQCADNCMGYDRKKR